VAPLPDPGPYRITGSQGVTTGRRSDLVGNNAALAVFAGVSYGTGVLVGLLLRLPGSTPSVLWPPNAILTAFLLLIAPRRWWVVFLGAAVAHFAVELQVWPAPLTAAILLTNCSEALIAAGFVRLVSDRPDRFDTLRRTALFILGGALLAPFLSSFFDAAAVNTFTGENYWTVWKTRFLSNVLTELAVVPAVVGLVDTGTERLAEWRRSEWTHAVSITATFLALAVVLPSRATHAVIGSWPLPLFLPLLLWTAVRFGPTGAGLAIVTTVLVNIASAMRGHELLAVVPATERVTLLQLFLVMVSIPVMCLAALVEERRRAEATARANDALKSAILSSISSLVVVLDRQGRAITANARWVEFARRHLGRDFSAPGTDYLDMWGGQTGVGAGHARAIVDGVRGVLAGSPTPVTLEYPWDVAGAPQWWTLSVVPLQRSGGGAVLTHSDATVRRLAEIAAQRHRAQMARTARTLALGELTSSLWHRLSQPLTGIMGNAQAGRRFLDAPAVDLDEIRHIFTDIVSDAVRATAIIDTVRDTLRQPPSEYQMLDLNAIIRDTAALIADEALARRISLQTTLAAGLPDVRGERLLVQQVVLQLLTSAMEALSERARDERLIRIATERHGEDVLVSVYDSSEAGPLATIEDIFDPWSATPPPIGSLGLALSISRAIVQSHGGRIWVDKQTAGTTINLTLPISEAGAVV
jgi:integral membrane sensor domain MASE1/nitrogen-specific signal transduction histidine kinase